MSGEDKDQDRAAWYDTELVGAVADGTTRSLHSAIAADLAVKASPGLLKGNTHERLAGLCETLFSCRAAAQQAEIDTSTAANPVMGRLLQEILRKKLAKGFQTTLVAIRLCPSNGAVQVKGISCGDSFFGAFTPDGRLLASSLSFPANANAPEDNLPLKRSCGLTFEPGDELLAKVLGDASTRPALARQAGLSPENAGHWLICLPLDLCSKSPNTAKARSKSSQQIALGTDNLLLVPYYLADFSTDPKARQYCRFLYSRNIKTTVGGPGLTPEASFDGKSSVTAVFPDHFENGRWTLFTERFEPDVHFVLASDGFYSSFHNSREMWAWLQAHQDALSDDARRAQALDDVHRRLAAGAGDDDVSLIWVRPVPTARPDQEKALSERTSTYVR